MSQKKITEETYIHETVEAVEKIGRFNNINGKSSFPWRALMAGNSGTDGDAFVTVMEMIFLFLQ